MAYGIFLAQGSNLCLLPCQVDSLPLSRQGSTGLSFIISPLISPVLEGIVVIQLLRYPLCACLRCQFVQMPSVVLSQQLVWSVWTLTPQRVR